MLKQLFILLSAGIVFISCKKSTSSTVGCVYTESTTKAPATEIAYLAANLAVSHPAAIADTSGIYYEITTPSTGSVAPGVCNNVSVIYAGKLLGSTTNFDASTTDVNFTLGGTIVGWQKGLAKLKAGGSMKLYIPPTLGYGATTQRNSLGVVTIPANSYLEFTITLDAVN